MSGRGPTRLMSPRTTLTSCGSSSSDQRRSTVPTRVCRGSSYDGYPDRRSSPTYVIDGATRRSGSIVRNFTIVNRRPSRPMRRWCNSTGEPRRARTIAATASWTGADSTSSASRRRGRARACRAACTTCREARSSRRARHDRSEERKRFGPIYADLRTAVAGKGIDSLDRARMRPGVQLVGVDVEELELRPPSTVVERDPHRTVRTVRRHPLPSRWPSGSRTRAETASVQGSVGPR